MANEERLQALAERLLERTGSKALRWTAAGNEQFQLSLPTGAVLMEKGPNGLASMHVYDDSGNQVEALIETNQTHTWDTPLQQLWNAARSSALNIDTVLDSIFKDVETAGSPAEDDIPF
jgi:hypothetical protein